MSAKVISRLAALVLAAVVLAACGGPSGVKPAKYVHVMCSALASWRGDVKSASATLQSSGAANASAPVAKRAYQQFVASILSATERAAGALESAGRPSIDTGKQMADGLANAFASASHELARASEQAGAISTASPSSFQLGASSVTTQIKSAFQAIAAVQPSHNVALRTAAAQDPACQVLRG